MQSLASALERHHQKQTAVLVGVFEGKGKPTRWAYSCRICSDEGALVLEATGNNGNKSLVDLAVLQITAMIEANPPVFDGSLESLEIINDGLSANFFQTLSGPLPIGLRGQHHHQSAFRIAEDGGVHLRLCGQGQWAQLIVAEAIEVISGGLGLPKRGCRGRDRESGKITVVQHGLELGLGHSLLRHDFKRAASHRLRCRPACL